MISSIHVGVLILEYAITLLLETIEGSKSKRRIGIFVYSRTYYGRAMFFIERFVVCRTSE